jgi:uncharacterized protein YbaR (Trm112 family)
MSTLSIEATHIRMLNCGVCKHPVFYSENEGVLWCRCGTEKVDLSDESLKMSFFEWRD